MSLGRKSRSSAHWEPKSPPRNAAADDEKKGEFNQEEVEADLSHYKKGVFYFDETLKPNSSAMANGNGYGKGHAKLSPSKAEHQQFQLTLSDKPLPPLSNKKVSSRIGSTQPTDDSKDNSPDESKQPIPIEKKKRRKAVVVTQQPQPHRRRPHQMPMPRRVQPIVTISPNRTARNMHGQRGQRGHRGHGPSPYGAFVPPPSDYYYTQSAAYPYGAPNAAPSYYDLYPPNYPRNQNNQLSHPNADYSPYLPNQMNNVRAPGTMGEDGLWYPFAEAGKDAYSTPKKGVKKGGKKSAVDKEMSPGRRVNQIQKQLEYYFSPVNLDADEFLRSAMDADGWVRIDVLIPFARMKVLGATKELVIEAAFHSTVIEIDHVAQDKVRMTAQWKAYCKNGKEKAEKAEKEKKRASKSSKEREREKLIQRELDNAEVTESTIDAIVALVEKKQERRAKRRELREREKAKRKQKEEKESEKENDGEETKTTKSEATEELIKQDQAEVEAKNADVDGDADSKGDPDNNDMVEID